jgi:hypothetical protein
MARMSSRCMRSFVEAVTVFCNVSRSATLSSSGICNSQVGACRVTTARVSLVPLRSSASTASNKPGTARRRRTVRRTGRRQSAAPRRAILLPTP